MPNFIKRETWEKALNAILQTTEAIKVISLGEDGEIVIQCAPEIQARLVETFRNPTPILSKIRWVLREDSGQPAADEGASALPKLILPKTGKEIIDRLFSPAFQETTSINEFTARDEVPGEGKLRHYFVIPEGDSPILLAITAAKIMLAISALSRVDNLCHIMLGEKGPLEKGPSDGAISSEGTKVLTFTKFTATTGVAEFNYERLLELMQTHDSRFWCQPPVIAKLKDDQSAISEKAFFSFLSQALDGQPSVLLHPEKDGGVRPLVVGPSLDSRAARHIKTELGLLTFGLDISSSIGFVNFQFSEDKFQSYKNEIKSAIKLFIDTSSEKWHIKFVTFGVNISEQEFLSTTNSPEDLYIYIDSLKPENGTALNEAITTMLAKASPGSNFVIATDGHNNPSSKMRKINDTEVLDITRKTVGPKSSLTLIGFGGYAAAFFTKLEDLGCFHFKLDDPLQLKRLGDHFSNLNNQQMLFEFVISNPDTIHKVPVFAGQITAASFTLLNGLLDGVSVSEDDGEWNIWWDASETPPNAIQTTGEVAPPADLG